MEAVLAEAGRQGAAKAVRLHVSVLSHCPLLKPVADVLANRIAAMSLTSPQLTHVGNVSARALRTKEWIADVLVNNIAHGVRWHDATTVLKELGCRLFLEMPPGHTLTELARAEPSRRRLDASRSSYTTSNTEIRAMRAGVYLSRRSISIACR
jgi:malonate decarboxylase epsilon subunit